MDCPTEEALIRDRLGKELGVITMDFNLMQRVLDKRGRRGDYGARHDCGACRADFATNSSRQRASQTLVATRVIGNGRARRGNLRVAASGAGMGNHAAGTGSGIVRRTGHL